MSFDPQAFLETAIESELSTERPLFPEGEYMGEIQQIDVKPTKNPSWAMLQLVLAIDDQEVAERMGRKNCPFNYNFVLMLELDEHGALALTDGKNILTGQLRKACGQNNAARPWKFGDVVGHTILFQVVHEHPREDNGRGPNERIKRIVAA